MGDAKKIAVIVRDRPGEALRVAGGLTLADDTIEVFVLDRKLDKTDPEIAQPLELVDGTRPEEYTPIIRKTATQRSRLRRWRRNSLSMTIVVPY